jgi:hypothetical protein
VVLGENHLEPVRQRVLLVRDRRRRLGRGRRGGSSRDDDNRDRNANERGDVVVGTIA